MHDLCFFVIMENMTKSKFKRYYWNKYGIIVTIVVIIVLFFVFRSGGKAPKLESATATLGSVIEKVSVTGKVSPVGKADLAFEKSGVLAVLNFKVGDHVKKGDVIAVLDSGTDMANLASAQAKLADLSRGLNTTEASAEQSKVTSAQVALGNSKQDALNAARSGLAEAQAAVNNYADIFFNNPQTVNPTINIGTDSYGMQISINAARLSVGEALQKWKNETDVATSLDSALTILTHANSYLNTIKSFMSDLSAIVNKLNTVNSGLSQATISADVASMNSAQSGVSQAANTVTTALANLQNASSSFAEAQSAFNLKSAGSSAQTIAAQAATVASFRAELAKDSLVSPIDGLITKADPNLGEFVAAGQSGFAVQSDGDYKVEAFVAESDIAKVAVGNNASTTLDAYGQDVDFPATVTMIDPAETVLEGVPTYKVTLHFINADPRIRSGMTANLDILTHEVDDVIEVPARAVIDIDGVKNVRVLKADGKTFTPVEVTTGLKGSDGTIEIKSGISEGEKVVTYVQ